MVDRGVDVASIAFAGGDRGIERDLLAGTAFELTELPGRGIQRRFTLANFSAAFSLIRGVVKGIGLVRRSRPDVVVVLGGYASFACGVGAVIWRHPLVLCEQNARAGAVNRTLRFFAARSAVSFAGTDLPNETVTGNPLRFEIVRAAQARDANPGSAQASAREELGLPTDRTVILVTTGSLGARSVNNAVRGLVNFLADRCDLAIRHVVGHRDYPSLQANSHEATDGLVYQVVEYEDRMNLALSAADLVIGRSGGGVAEFAALGVPAILVPLPIAPRDHQRANAQHLVDAGGAVLIDDAECTTDRLAEEVTALLDATDRRQAMSEAMRAWARLDAADAVAEVIMEVVDEH